MREYFNYSLRPSYNLVLAGVLLLLYETLIGFSHFLYEGVAPPMVNAVDSLITALLNMAPNGRLIVGVFLALFGLFFIITDIRKGVKLQASFFLMMFVESAFWALLIYLNLGWLNEALFGGVIGAQQVAAPVKPPFIYSVGLSLGAGFYEELLFRLIMVKALQGVLWASGRNYQGLWPSVAISVLTALLFSLVHFQVFVGPLGDPFTLDRLFYRFLFGLMMSLLIVYRGFGITAWTHALYDVYIDFARALFS